jgi:adenine-specific DNA-methyltransferase
MTENYTKLRSVLSEIFQLNQADLDFGLYRILNQKRSDIQRFLDNDLLPQVKMILEKTGGSTNKEAKTELENLEKTLLSAGMNPDNSPKVKELRQQLVSSTDVDLLEQQVFSHLTVFFKRYYDKGDFISKRRYKADTYAIPYEGEEVKLYWANHDQYYIKTTEYLKNYGFTLSDGKKVRFQLIEASAEQNNNKSQDERLFKIFSNEPLEKNGETLTINFTYEPTNKKEQQKALNEVTAQAVSKVLPNDFYELLTKKPTEKNKNRTLLDKHIRDFTARNTFDYFIHKDLGGFLRRELDFYIKSEILQLDDIDYEKPQSFTEQLAKINALRSVAHKIIDFLAQLEEFQKRLWLKKKFVVDTNYCITLDKIDEKFYTIIAENEAQWTEWEKLFAISEIETDLFNKSGNDRLSILKAQPHLVLDTAFFSADFKNELIATFDNLDAELDGLLIHSENFQALNLLQNRYHEQVKCAYIDPPYNTAASEIIYKNDYKHSSWLSFINDRLQLSRSLLDDTGILAVTIDDYEYHRLQYLLEDIMGKSNFLANVLIRNNPSGRSTVKGFAVNHEYAVFYSKSDLLTTVGRLSHGNEQLSRYNEIDSLGKRFEWESFRKSGTDSDRENRPKQYFSIFYNKKTEELRVPTSNWNDEKNCWDVKDQLGEEEIEILPIHPTGRHKVWKYGKSRTEDDIKEFRVKEKEYSYEIYRKKHLNTKGSLPRTWWENSSYSARDNGTSAIRNLFGNSSTFSFPKSVYAVIDSLKVSNADETSTTLDYFAGSGTTGHAVINLNREDNGKRKYILVEMGEYFDSVTKPRIQKIVYSADWKDGKPVSRKGSSHAFKYIRLESYEDVLNNLQLKSVTESLDLRADFKEDYTLNYWLNVETRDSLLTVQSFRKPFDYTLQITQDNEMRPTKIDLVETFNYLIGLQVKTSYRVSDIHIVIGDTISGEHSLVIWRDMDKTDNAALNEFFVKMEFSTLDTEFDRIYVNGDNNLENLKTEADKWKVELIESVFFREM